jgi:hypothetical protein
MTGTKEDITYKIPDFGSHCAFTHKTMRLIMSVNIKRVLNYFNERVMFLFSYMVKSNLHLVKYANMINRKKTVEF